MSLHSILVCKDCKEEFVVTVEGHEYLQSARRKKMKYCRACYLQRKREQRALQHAQECGYAAPITAQK